MKEKNNVFEISESTTRNPKLSHLEPNNTNSKTEMQNVGNTGIGNKDANKSSKQRNKKKDVATGESMLNCISEKGLSKSHKVIVENFPGGTSNTTVENLDQLLKENPDDLIIHVGTNDLKMSKY